MLTSHPEKLEEVDLIKVANKFVQKTSYTGCRMKLFGKFVQSDLDDLLRMKTNFEQPVQGDTGKGKQKDNSDAICN